MAEKELLEIMREASKLADLALKIAIEKHKLDYSTCTSFVLSETEDEPTFKFTNPRVVPL